MSMNESAQQLGTALSRLREDRNRLNHINDMAMTVKRCGEPMVTQWTIFGEPGDDVRKAIDRMMGRIK